MSFQCYVIQLAKILSKLPSYARRSEIASAFGTAINSMIVVIAASVISTSFFSSSASELAIENYIENREERSRKKNENY